MKYITVAALGLVLLSACHNTDTKTNDHPPAAQPVTDSLTRRSALIKALEELQKDIASGDKHRIGAYFQFPVPDSTVEFYSMDSTFTAAKADAGGMTTETFFNTWYDKFSPAMGLQEFDTLFQRIDIRQLLQKNTLRFNGRREDQRCYKFYSVDREGDSTAVFMYGSTYNDDYLKTHPDTTQVANGDPDSCGGGMLWIFFFDGRRLHVRSHSALD